MSLDGLMTYEKLLQDQRSDLRKKVVAVNVNGEVVDLRQAHVEGDVFQWVEESSKEGLDVIRHSCAHLMAQAVKQLYPHVKVCIGPVIENGFYYDFYHTDAFTPVDLIKIEKRMQAIAAKKIPIDRQEWSREEAKQCFEKLGETFKLEVIESISPDQVLTVYQQGDFLDLCRGPHVPHTGHLMAFKLMKCSGAYWRGDSGNAPLQRIYGTAWSCKEELEKYLLQLAERERRDHRRIGKAMDLFHTQKEAPGMVFWHAPGWVIYGQLMKFMQQMYVGKYQEVRTPQLAAKELWEASGHWDMFHQNMFITESEKQEYAVKPMNCPCHVQIYNQGLHSYRDLPLRLAEFGCCHRNEPSGTLSGLMRVRQFVQDDGHIFCSIDQIASEVKAFIHEAFDVYRIFGFTDIIVRLSTRPDKYVGLIENWDRAESALASILDQLEIQWELQPGEGAFYGPKIEFSLKDCLDRVWQCGTVQIDFSMPERLGAHYITADGQKEHPVMLHRAILGSLERFIGILIEHYAGEFPMWLAPVQCVVLNISENSIAYCRQQAEKLRALGMRVELDVRNEKIGYKIREHVLRKVPYVLVAGSKEVEEQTLNVRHQGESVTVSLEAWWATVKDQCGIPVCGVHEE